MRIPNRPWDIGGLGGACILACQPYLAPSTQDAFANLIPGKQSPSGTTPDWLSHRGWIFNGSSHWLSSTVTVTSSTTVLMRWSNAITTNERRMFGANDYLPTDADVMIAPASYYGSFAVRLGWSSNTITGTSLVSGVGGFSGAALCRNGELTAGTIGTLPPRVSYIGAFNNRGSAGGYWSGEIQAIWIYSTTMSAAEARSACHRLNSLDSPLYNAWQSQRYWWPFEVASAKAGFLGTRNWLG